MNDDNATFIAHNTATAFAENAAITASPPVDTEVSLATNARSDVYFQTANMIIGIIGTLSNGFIVTVLVREWRRNKHTINVLLLNQLVLDLYSSIWLFATYVVKLCHIWLVGSTGYWLCQFVISEALLWVGLEGSTWNLAAIAIERYLKVCHPLWHKVHFRSWIVYVTVLFLWVSSTAVSFGSVLPTTDIDDGHCLAQLVWQSTSAETAFGIWFYLSYYIVQLGIFVFCYGRIFFTIRHQEKIFPGAVAHVPDIETPQQKQTHMKLLKTSFFLTLSFAICWLPCHTCYLLMNLQIAGLNLSTDAWYGTLFFAFSNIACNPFIYGAKSGLVKNVIPNLMNRFCKIFRVKTDYGMSETNHSASQ